MVCLELAGLKEVNILTAHHDLAKQHSTCLDNDQMVAMLACLRQELTLIQGPPGTGEQEYKQIYQILSGKRNAAHITPLHENTMAAGFSAEHTHLPKKQERNRIFSDAKVCTKSHIWARAPHLGP